MKIRFANLGDLASTIGMAKALMQESRFRHLSLDENKARAIFGDILKNPATSCLLLACDATGAAIGMLAGQASEYYFCSGLMVQDRWFYVMPEHRGSSAAIKLLAALRRWAEVREANELCINMSVAIDMERFNRLMTRLGFACCGSNFTLGLAKNVSHVH